MIDSYQELSAEPFRGKQRPLRSKRGITGISLIEVFVAMAIVAVALAFAASPLEKMSARIDVDMASENVVHALETARKAAVRANVPVRVFVTDKGVHRRVVAGFLSPRSSLDFYYLPDYEMPEHVTFSLSEGLSPIVFDSIGRVDKTGFIRLSSSLNPAYFVEIRLPSSAGIVQVDDGLRQKLDKLSTRAPSSKG